MKQALIEVRNSPIHGSGVFALRRIRKGTAVIEYLGDRISHEEVDERYADKSDTDNHTFLFTVNSKIVIDAGRDGNDARFINHACDPNCESTIKNKRVFIEAIRTIQPGEELNYDYAIGRDDDDAPNVDEIFACRCGAATCRGSMLEPRKPPRKKPRAKARAKARGQRGKRGADRARQAASRGTRAASAGGTRASKAGSKRASKAGSKRASKAGSKRASKAGSKRASKAGSKRASNAGGGTRWASKAGGARASERPGRRGR